MGDPPPDGLTSFLRERGLAHVRDLVVNPRKGQHTLLVRDEDDRLMVLKYRAPGSQSRFVEPEIYAGAGRSHMPELLDSSAAHVLLEYTEAETLRHRLGEGSLPEGCRQGVVDALVSAPRVQEAARVADVLRVLVGTLVRLLSSGPRGAPVGSGLRRLSRRALARSVPTLLRPMLAARARESVARGPAVRQHGDLHLDNVLVGTDGDVVIVDWEDAFVGTPICDWLYFWPQYLRIAGPDEVFDAFRREAASRWPDQLTTFERLLPVYLWAVRRNARFAESGAGAR